VVLHGLLDSSEGWTPVCKAVDGKRIAFDLPGFGHSDAPQKGSIAGYAADVSEGLEELGIGRFTLIGHSLGGAIAAALAESMPDRVRALVLLAPAGFGRLPLAEAVSIPGVRNLVQTALPFALASGVAVRAGYMTIVSHGMAPDRALVERVTSRGGELVAGAREGTRAVVEAGRADNAFHHRRMLYRGPVYGVWGDRDRLVPTSHHRGVRRAFPQAQIEFWPGMGHHATCERFDELLELVKRVVASSEPASSRSASAQGRAA